MATGGEVTRPERAARRIAEIAHGVGAGARLGTKAEIRAACGVSIGTFNEALRLAQARGVVEVRPGPGGGLFATRQPPLVRLGNSMLALDSDQTSVADAIRIRDALDRVVITDAARHSSPADIDGYRARLDEMAAAKAEADPAAFMAANWRLHELLVEVNPSAMLRAIYLTLLEIIRAPVVDFLAAEGFEMKDLFEARYRVHVDLVDAISERDPDRLERAITAHSVEHAKDLERTAAAEH